MPMQSARWAGSRESALPTKRMNAKANKLDSGHLSLITYPREITELILTAARATLAPAQR